MPFNELYSKIRGLEEFDVVRETMSIINENSGYLANLLKIQLRAGKDGNNENVTIFGKDYYADRTIQNKRYNSPTAFGKFSEWITNYFSGAFYNSLHITTEGTQFIFDSDVPYFYEIIRRSGEIILELNKEHLAMFTEEILRPELEIRFKLHQNAF